MRACDGCGRFTMVEHVALMVEGVVQVERCLCAACRSAATDDFQVAHAAWLPPARGLTPIPRSWRA